MIYILAVALIAIVILIALLVREKQSTKYWRKRFDEQHSLSMHYKVKIGRLSKDLVEIKNKQSFDPDAQEQGNFVRTRKLQRATPETYRNLFDLDVNGQRVLEHLTTVFCRDAFASTDRETNYRLGQHSVINFIINNINQANHPNYKEEVND